MAYEKLLKLLKHLDNVQDELEIMYFNLNYDKPVDNNELYKLEQKSKRLIKKARKQAAKFLEETA